MEKALVLLMTFSLLLSLCACGTQPTKNNNATPITEKSSATTTTAPTTASLVQEAYDIAVAEMEHAKSNNTSNYRELGELQPETQAIILLNGKPYQSYVASNVDIRYIWLSNSEFPQPQKEAAWDWVTVGTSTEYSLDLLGTIDEGRK